MNPPRHFSDPKLSCWQAAVAHVGSKPLVDGAAPPLHDHEEPLLKAATVAATARQSGAPAKTSILQSVADCAKIALDIGLAEVAGDQAKALELRNAFAQYGKCDLRWNECIEQFKNYYKTATTTKQYRRWTSQSDFMSDDLPERCRIGVIGDWGTGQDRADALLRNLAKHKPDIVIHLGDIYYACTAPEADLFFDQMRVAFGAKMPRIFSLCGNHDMYSGGVAYQALLKRIDQPASFFGLRNASWQILSADTGFNDFDPNTQGTIASWIQDRDEGDDYSELDWHRDKFATAGGRRTIFCTHHQPFTRNSPIDGGATNERLLAQMAPNLDKVALWLWGHEHNQVVYGPYREVRAGRCVGASGVPAPGSDKIYALAPGLKGWQAPAILQPNRTQLAVDDRTGLYNLGYALIELDGASGNAVYLQFNSSKNASGILFQEDL